MSGTVLPNTVWKASRSSTGALRIADRLREGVRRLHREARPVEAHVERDVAGADGARRGVLQHLADREVLEEVAELGFACSLPLTAPTA